MFGGRTGQWELCPGHLVLKASFPELLDELSLRARVVVETLSVLGVEGQQERVERRVLIASRSKKPLAQHQRLADELVDQDGRLSARSPELPEEPLAEAVDRPGANLVDVDGIDEGLLLRRQRQVVLKRIDDVKSPAEDAGPKLLCGLLRKGGRQNAAGLSAVHEYELENAQRHTCRLTCARPRHDKNTLCCRRRDRHLLLSIRGWPEGGQRVIHILNRQHKLTPSIDEL